MPSNDLKINEGLQAAIDLARNGDVEAAVELLHTLSESYPKSGKVWGYLGFLLRENRELERAAKAFRKAVAISRRSEKASLGLFHTLWALGKHEQAFREMRRYLDLGEANEYLVLLRDMITDPQQSVAEAAEGLAMLGPNRRGTAA